MITTSAYRAVELVSSEYKAVEKGEHQAAHMVDCAARCSVQSSCGGLQYSQGPHFLKQQISSFEKYRSVQELRSSSIASFSGNFDLILFQAVNF